MTYSCTAPAAAGTGNTGADPLFLDPAGGNWRLRADSPCVNAGSSGYPSPADLDGGARVFGPAADMGAYEVGAPAVTAPAAGATWLKGSACAIRWRNFPGAAVRVDLLRAGAVVAAVSPSAANDGSLSWTVPATLAAGTGYAVRVLAPLKQIPSVQAVSATFTITAGACHSGVDAR